MFISIISLLCKNMKNHDSFNYLMSFLGGKQEVWVLFANTLLPYLLIVFVILLPNQTAVLFNMSTSAVHLKLSNILLPAWETLKSDLTQEHFFNFFYYEDQRYAQQLGVLTTLLEDLEDLSSNPSTLLAAYSHLQLQGLCSSLLGSTDTRHACDIQMYMQTNIHTHRVIKYILKMLR